MQRFEKHASTPLAPHPIAKGWEVRRGKVRRRSRHSMVEKTLMARQLVEHNGNVVRRIKTRNSATLDHLQNLAESPMIFPKRSYPTEFQLRIRSAAATSNECPRNLFVLAR